MAIYISLWMLRELAVDPSAPVNLIETDDDYDRQATGLQVDIEPPAYGGFPEPLTFHQARELVTVIDKVLASGGDAHAILQELRQWRDRLLGVGRWTARGMDG